MQALMGADPGIFHACDTEVMDIALKEVGPVGNGYVTCVSVYSGPDFDYGFGTKGTTLWIDNLDDAYGVLQEFKEWFEDDRFLKVWHNYGFDRHVMWNEGIDCRGFGGDTMHMARLQDTSRLKNGGGGYSLEALTAELLQMRKRPMKEIFGVPRIRKDGSPGSLVDVPPIEVFATRSGLSKEFHHLLLLRCGGNVAAPPDPNGAVEKNEMAFRRHQLVRLLLGQYEGVWGSVD